MLTLRLLQTDAGTGNHGGEIFACSYTPDSAFVLSGGWDGQLRLWEAESGQHVSALRVSPKPVSACAVSPDGKQWLSASLDGLLAFWNAKTQVKTTAFVPGGRPVSAVVFGGDEKTLATASWDGNLVLWSLGRDRGSRTLSGHSDIVAGCGFTPDAQALLSWSYDRTVRLWDTGRGKNATVFNGHADRVTAGAVSPDGLWAVTGSRDGMLKLWDLQNAADAATLTLPGEVRGCFFFLDGESVGAVDAKGRIAVYSLPEFKRRGELSTGCPVQCAALAPSGSQLALGCDDGHVRLVAVDGFDSAPLAVTAIRTSRRTATTFQKLFGRSRVVYAYAGNCPVCRQAFEKPQDDGNSHWECGSCRRQLRVGAVRHAEPAR